MMAIKQRALLLFFVVAAIAALALHFFLFEMRYMWYPPMDAFRAWRGIYIVCAAAIIALWMFFPSRVMVVLIGFFAMFFPHLYPPGLVEQSGRHLDLPSIAFATLSVALLVGATALRRRLKRAANKG